MRKLKGAKKKKLVEINQMEMDVSAPNRDATILCKECFENYQRHTPTIHMTCWWLLKEDGCGDARPPKREYPTAI